MKWTTACSVLALAVVAGTQACRRAPDPIHQERLARMLLTSDSLIAVTRALDTTAVAHHRALFLADRDLIEKRFADTLLPSEAALLGNYYRLMQELAPQVLNGLRTLAMQLDSSHERLGALSHDVSWGLGDRDRESRNLDMEAAAQQRAKQAVTELGGLLGHLAEQQDKLRQGTEPLIRHHRRP